MRNQSTHNRIQATVATLGLSKRQRLLVLAALTLALAIAATAGAQYYETSRSSAANSDAAKELNKVETSAREEITSPTDTSNPADEQGVGTDVRTESNGSVVTPDASNSSEIRTDITVNGQSIPVPDNGSTHQIIQDDNGKTSVDISIESHSSGNDTERRSSGTRYESSSRSSINIHNSE